MSDPRQTLADFTFASKYARYLPEQNRRETYDEAVDRMMAMHRQKYGYLPNAYFEIIEDELHNKRILGSQRALQFGGEGVLRKHMRLYNCSYSFCDRPRFFAEALWLLLCGCGVGFSVQKHHVAKLPKLTQPEHLEAKVEVIEDSIEGWANALDALVNSFMSDMPAKWKMPVRFDYSQIRPEGSPISSSSGKAPGPKALRDSLEAVREVLSRVVDEQGGVLRPIDAYDIVMHASNCVRAGGIRRSATIALFSPDDADMTNAKTGDWWMKNPQRRLSNNSAHFVRKTASKEQFMALIKSTKEFGEPGFFFANSTEHGTNPCAEIGLEPSIDSLTGWAFCNLTSVNVGACKTQNEFYVACAAAAWLGTLQAGYMDTGYLGRTTQRIMERDALLGVSLTGMADNPAIAFDENTLMLGAEIVKASNAVIAKKIGINSAARLTTVKPEGTGSLVLKVGNGIHPHHARHYLRYVEAGKLTDPLVRFMAEQIPEAVVPSAYAKDEYKVVFPIDLGEGDLWLKSETDPISHLEKVRLVQNAWVLNGTQRGDLNHNVSNTIQVPNDRWNDVAEHIWQHRDSYGGVSLLGTSGDLDYAQAPFVEVLIEDSEILNKYNGNDVLIEKAKAARDLWIRLREAWKQIDFKQCVETVDNSAGLETVACAGGACSF